MIAYIAGKLVEKQPTGAVIDCNGLGYFLKISLQTFSVIKDLEKDAFCKLFTFLHIKEDAHTLYGFSDIIEKNVFQELISVSGIGPGTALVMLSSIDAYGVQQAIANEDVKTIQSIKGIGAKTAQRVIIELKDKMRKGLQENSLDLQPKSYNTNRNEALTALVTLGVAKATAEKNIEIIIKKEGDQIKLEQLIKLALRMN